MLSTFKMKTWKELIRHYYKILKYLFCEKCWKREILCIFEKYYIMPLLLHNILTFMQAYAVIFTL